MKLQWASEYTYAVYNAEYNTLFFQKLVVFKYKSRIAIVSLYHFEIGPLTWSLKLILGNKYHN